MVSLDYPDPDLADEHVLLRPWRHADARAVCEASRDPYIPNVTTIEPSCEEHAAHLWIERQWSRQSSGAGISLAIVHQVQAVGAITLMHRPDPCVAGIGYWIVERARGRGLAVASVRMLGQWGIQSAGLDRIEALVEPWNVASMRALVRSGFQLEGQLRAYLDVAGKRADAVIYSLVAADMG